MMSGLFEERWRSQVFGRLTVASFLASFGLLMPLCAQIPVGVGGGYLDTFDTIPSIGNWSTRGIGATSADYSGTNAEAALDAAVQNFPASSFNFAVSNSLANPANSGTNATWSSSGHYLQTRVGGGIGAVTLMATLTNRSGFAITALKVRYDFAIAVAPGQEDIQGHRIYYNLSGNAGEWIPIGTVSSAGPQILALDFSPARWSAGTAMYLLFVDDNAVVNPEGAYQIDNFIITDVTVPRLEISRSLTSNELSIAWRGGGILQETTNLSGTNIQWTAVPGNPNPYTFTPAGAPRFFILRP